MYSNSAPIIWSEEISFSIRPCSILIISMFNSYVSHKSSKASTYFICLLLHWRLLMAECSLKCSSRAYCERACERACERSSSWSREVHKSMSQSLSCYVLLRFRSIDLLSNQIGTSHSTLQPDLHSRLGEFR